ncbi:MAG: T9SS type A sorting domain-containing protein [Bacteroidia bacterium]|nr:T9SS type A sorting domain-containing protein [Bacteroidia bacterium]
MKKILLIVSILLLHFSMLAQQAVFVNTSQVKQGQSLPVKITGIGTQFARGTNTAVFYKSGSPTEDLRLVNIGVANNTLMGGIIVAKINAQVGITYSCVIKNTMNADVQLTGIQVLQSGTGNGLGTFLISASPDTVAPDMTGGTTIIIKGYNTHFQSSGGLTHLIIYPHGSSIPTNKFSFGSEILNNTTLKLSLGNQSSTPHGWYDIRMANSMDTGLFLSKAFYFGFGDAPRLHDVKSNPYNIERDHTLDVSIIGVNTKFRQGSHTVSFFKQGSSSSGITVNSVHPQTTSFPGDSILIANITISKTAALGTYHLMVKSEKYVLYLLECIDIKENTTPQKYVEISPNSGAKGTTLQVSFSAVGPTNFTYAPNSVSFFRQGSPTNFITASNIQAENNFKLKSTLTISPNAPNGVYTYAVYNNLDNTLISLNNFEVKGGAELVSMSPNIGKQGQALPVTITGVRTHFTQGSGTNIIQFMRQGSPTFAIEGYANAVDDNSLSGGIIIANNAPFGFYDLLVINSIDGNLFLPNAFKVTENNGPRLVSISPALAGLGQSLTVTITGRKTEFTQGSQTLAFFRQGTPSAYIFTGNYQTINDTSLTVDVDVSNMADRGFYSIGLVKNWDTTGVSLLFLMDAFEVTFPIGLNQLSSKQNEVKIYPNPTQNELHIATTSDNIDEVIIYDMLGRILWNNTPLIPSKEIEIKLTEFIKPNQTIFVQVKTQKGIETKRVIVRE